MGPLKRGQDTLQLPAIPGTPENASHQVVHEVFADNRELQPQSVLRSPSTGSSPTSRPPLPMNNPLPRMLSKEVPIGEAPSMTEHMDKDCTVTSIDAPEVLIIPGILRSDKHESNEPYGSHGRVAFSTETAAKSGEGTPTIQPSPVARGKVSFNVHSMIVGDSGVASLGLPSSIASKGSSYGLDRSLSRKSERSHGNSHGTHSYASYFTGTQSMKSKKPTASMHVQSLRSTFQRARTKELGFNLEDCEEADLTALRFEWQRRLARVLSYTYFEVFIIACIALNTLVLIFEDQLTGFERGYSMNYPGVPTQAATLWHDWRDLFTVLEWLFGVIFTVELLLKLISFEHRVFADAWGWIDTIIVLGFIVERVHSMDLETSAAVVRSVKMLRLLRVLKLTHSLQAFDNFYLMTAALRESMSASMYAFLLLLMLQVIVALLIESALRGYLTDDSEPLASRQLVFQYYGTFTRSLLTVFEVTLANWPEPVRILTEHVSEWWGIVFLAYVLCVGFAVVRVIMSVFTSVTFFVYEFDDQLMVARHKRATTLHSQKMTELFKAADADGNGLLDLDEFRSIFADAQVQKWLGAMEFGFSLHGSGADALFHLLDDGDETLRAQELIDGVAQLKGPAKAVGLAVVMRELKEVEMLVSDIMRELRKSAFGCDASRNTVSSERSKSSRKSKETTKGAQTSPPPGDDASDDSSSSGESLPRLSSTQQSQRRLSMDNWKTARQISAESIGSVAGRLFVSDTMSTTSIESRLTRIPTEASSSYRLAFKSFMHSARVEAFFIVMLVIYAILCMIEAQYDGIQVGFEVGHENHGRPASEEWPGVREALDPCLIAMGSLFWLELLGKFIGHGAAVLRNTWNIVDIVANVSWLLELTPWVAAEKDSIPLQLSLLRFVRVTRLSRLLVLVHLSQRFSKLQLMWTAIRGSMHALGWTIVTLVFSLIFVALTLSTLLEEDYEGEADAKDRWRIYLFFGSFSKSMLTMFELTLANWIMASRALVETSSEWYTLFFLCHKISFGFCIVTVIAAVFLQETFTIAKNDNAVQHNMRVAAAKEHTKKMVKLFKAADADGSGAVDFDEFMGIMQSPGIALWLAAMGLHLQDLDAIFHTMDDGDEELTAEEFMEGLAHMKGIAKNIDLNIIHKELRKRCEELQSLLRRCDACDEEVRREYSPSTGSEV